MGKTVGFGFFGISERRRVEGACGGLQPSRLPCRASSKGRAEQSCWCPVKSGTVQRRRRCQQCSSHHSVVPRVHQSPLWHTSLLSLVLLLCTSASLFSLFFSSKQWKTEVWSHRAIPRLNKCSPSATFGPFVYRGTQSRAQHSDVAPCRGLTAPQPAGSARANTAQGEVGVHLRWAFLAELPPGCSLAARCALSFPPRDAPQRPSPRGCCSPPRVGLCSASSPKYPS